MTRKETKGLGSQRRRSVNTKSCRTAHRNKMCILASCRRHILSLSTRPQVPNCSSPVAKTNCLHLHNPPLCYFGQAAGSTRERGSCCREARRMKLLLLAARTSCVTDRSSDSARLDEPLVKPAAKRCFLIKRRPDSLAMRSEARDGNQVLRDSGVTRVTPALNQEPTRRRRGLEDLPIPPFCPPHSSRANSIRHRFYVLRSSS